MEEKLDYIDKIGGMIMDYAPKVALAGILLIVGFWVIGKIMDMVSNAMTNSALDENIQPFLKSILAALLKVLLIFSVVGILGVETSSFVAILAAAGFAVGMALQGSLGNFAAGVMILLFKPYKIGDHIELQGEEGYVKEIEIINTVIETLDGVTVIIPNAKAIEDNIRNYTKIGSRRINLNIYMPYEESFPAVREIILEAMKNTPGVLDSPAPEVGIESYDTHSIVLAMWPYCKTDDYWDVYFNVNRNVKNALNAKGIKVAYSEGVELGPIGA